MLESSSTERIQSSEPYHKDCSELAYFRCTHTLIAHHEPGHQHHIKSGGTKIFGNNYVLPRQRLTHLLSEALHSLAKNSVKQ